MNIYVGFETIEKSNEFLRSLWAEMKNEFGKCSWQYTPYKYKNSVYFGFMDIGLEKNIEVGITYKKKGCIHDIFFIDDYGRKKIEKKGEIFTRLSRVIDKAKSNVGNYKLFEANLIIDSFFSVNNYEGDNFSLLPMKNNKTQLSIAALAYDGNQVNEFLLDKAEQIMNFLSVETNAIYEMIKSDSELDNLYEEVFENEDFIDDNPIEKNRMIISVQAKKIINVIATIDDNNSHELAVFLKACSLFHAARKIEQNTVQQHPKGYKFVSVKADEDEISSILYLSALETVTTIGFEEQKCSECGQPKYQINKRVRDLVSKYLPKHLVADFNAYYSKRSKYLHTGEKSSSSIKTSSSIPLLDLDSKNGCKIPIGIPTKNIREYVSYCLRNYYKENLDLLISKK